MNFYLHGRLQWYLTDVSLHGYWGLDNRVSSLQILLVHHTSCSEAILISYLPFFSIFGFLLRVGAVPDGARPLPALRWPRFYVYIEHTISHAILWKLRLFIFTASLMLLMNTYFQKEAEAATYLWIDGVNKLVWDRAASSILIISSPPFFFFFIQSDLKDDTRQQGSRMTRGSRVAPAAVPLPTARTRPAKQGTQGVK